MFGTRLLTSLILIPVVIYGVLVLPYQYFALASAIILGLGVWEWSAFLGLKSLSRKTAYVAFWAVLIGLLYLLNHDYFWPLLLIALLWWVFACYAIFSYPAPFKQWRWLPPLYPVLGYLIFSSCWLGLLAFKDSILRPMQLLFLLLLIWAVDTGAYASGRLWGKHPLIPNVSPKKTFEGLLGGICLGLIWLIAGKWLLELTWSHWWVLAAISSFTVLFAIAGDLFESLIKREAGVKDSGHIVPGHGGLLDRIDSMLAAVPVFALGAYWWLV